MNERPAASGWLGRLRQGLAKSSGRLSDGIAGLFAKGRLDAETLESLEDLLIGADLGVAAATAVTERLAAARHDKGLSAQAVRLLMADTLADILTPLEKPLTPASGHRPHVVLVVGVNGTGKTTTIGKLAWHFRGLG
ncbi:MAG: signal recognition particle-docking protein FtsY, partial [Alphaproteobacteria bacterium]